MVVCVDQELQGLVRLQLARLLDHRQRPRFGHGRLDEGQKFIELDEHAVGHARRVAVKRLVPGSDQATRLAWHTPVFSF